MSSMLTYLIASHDCDVCDDSVTRVFTDSWSGREVCVSCLAEAGNDGRLMRLHMDPGCSEESDNIDGIFPEYDDGVNGD